MVQLLRSSTSLNLIDILVYSHHDITEIPNVEIAREARNSGSVKYVNCSPTKVELHQCHNPH